MLKNPNEFDKGKTIVYFIRHGERVHIPDKKNFGLEIPGPGLSALGKKQAKKVAKEISKIKDEIDVLYSSNMKRAIETAEEIGKKINKKPKIVPNISEFRKIVFERKIHKNEFWKHYFKQRKALKTFDKILLANNGKVIVIVAHGNVIKALIFRKLGLSLKNSGKFHNMNCNISVARYLGKRLDHVCSFNTESIKHSSI
ncbi:MAG: phosphoglycerate mutase family protein [Candidatus Pacearchaeota archaeon]